MSVAERSHQRTPPELQAHELVPANLSVGIRLWAGATVFFFLGPFFAYLYLRSLNSVDQWRPAGIDPPQVLGAATMALAAASSVALVLAARAWDRRGPLLGWLALGLGLGSVALQIVQYFRLDFGPTDGGYASVFVGWTGLTAFFTLATMAWLETLLAYALRGGDADVIRPRLAALAFYWPFLTGLAVVMWVVLYLA